MENLVLVVKKEHPTVVQTQTFGDCKTLTTNYCSYHWLCIFSSLISSASISSFLHFFLTPFFGEVDVIRRRANPIQMLYHGDFIIDSFSVTVLQ
jgi:hypothetical protein